MPSKRVIDFYDSKSFAIIGMSRTKKSFGWSIYDQLSAVGKTVYAVHPNGGVADGVEFFSSLQALPESPEAIIVCTLPKNTGGVLDAIKASGAKYVWFQQGSFDDEILSRAARLGLDPIKGCAHMYLPGNAFFHKFHRALNELFGKGYQ